MQMGTLWEFELLRSKIMVVYLFFISPCSLSLNGRSLNWMVICGFLLLFIIFLSPTLIGINFLEFIVIQLHASWKKKKKKNRTTIIRCSSDSNCLIIKVFDSFCACDRACHKVQICSTPASWKLLHLSSVASDSTLEAQTHHYIKESKQPSKHDTSS